MGFKFINFSLHPPLLGDNELDGLFPYYVLSNVLS